MLSHLRIKNFAIIEEVELDFPTGFTAITGETGAGKSILVGSLNLVLGGRASSDVIRTGAAVAEVEALFDISRHPIIRARLERRELVGDDIDTLLVRRVVGGKGRGKVIINGRLSTVATLQEIVRGLVDISGQHEQQTLLDVECHLQILDAFGELDEDLGAYRDRYEAYRRIRSERSQLERSEEELLRRADFLRFQLDEIRRLEPVTGEDDALEAERKLLSGAEKLQAGATLAEALLYGDDGSAFDKLGKATAELESLGQIDPALANMAEGLQGARREIEDVARDLQRYIQRIESDPERLSDVEGRLVELKRLCRKHGGSLEDVVARSSMLEEELSGLDNADARLEALREQEEKLSAEVLASGQRLSKARQRAAARLERAVAIQLREMELEDAVLQVVLRSRESPDGPQGVAGAGPDGLESAELLWSANPGEPAKPLGRIASGGELSRLMLAVKTVLSNRDLVSLYVFDEVDTGLGGRAADAIGRKIQSVAQGHQAITITHLAPIAARAEHHLRVAKTRQGKRTVSAFETVRDQARIEELARMIGGAAISEATRGAARTMLEGAST